jgi:methylaspartate mutase epsilon subunit
MTCKYRLLIGGLGDDAHSVGIWLLVLGFREEGFTVKSLGIRNDISDFMKHAGDFDLILISNNNGHAELYLEDFGRQLSINRLSWNSEKLWYLGGHISVSEPEHLIKKKFIGMGFTNVFPKPISFRHIMARVLRDLDERKIHAGASDSRTQQVSNGLKHSDLEGVTDERWSRTRLVRERERVLEEWETGLDVDLSSPKTAWLPAKQNLDSVLWKAKLEKRLPLIQPRTGVASISRQIEILQHLGGCGIDVASVQLDAASRTKFYANARTGVEVSEERKTSILNGFPVPIHGVQGVRRIVDALDIPFQIRAGGPDHRFTYEIALEGGATGVEGGFICYLFPYDKLTHPSESLKFWQYVDRLSALYEEEYGISINREYFGTLTANLIEPSLAIVVNIIQAILSARQGVRSLSIGYAEQGNRSQDIAAMQVLEAMTLKYLAKYGLGGCRVTTVFHQYMAAFPKDETKAEELIFSSAVTAALACATRVLTKSPVEAFKIPSEAENARGVRIVKKGLQAAPASFEDPVCIAFERALIESEVTQLMQTVEELGNGSLARGAMRAFEEGYLDIPFSPNVNNLNEVVTIRDRTGAVRFAECGNLPFDAKVKDFHHERRVERMMLERDSKLFSLLEKDLSRVWKNDYRAWPLDGHYVC